MVICDAVRAGKTEEQVYHLRGARVHVLADEFPYWRSLQLFVILSSLRPGSFPGYVKVIEDTTDRTAFYGRIEPPPSFTDADDLLPLAIPVRVRFPRPGRYAVQVWFFQDSDADVLKMEQPIHVFEIEG